MNRYNLPFQLFIKHHFFLKEFELTWRQDIRPKGRELCFDVSQQGKRASVTLIPCHGTTQSK